MLELQAINELKGTEIIVYKMLHTLLIPTISTILATICCKYMLAIFLFGW